MDRSCNGKHYALGVGQRAGGASMFPAVLRGLHYVRQAGDHDLNRAKRPGLRISVFVRRTRFLADRGQFALEQERWLSGGFPCVYCRCEHLWRGRLDRHSEWQAALRTVPTLEPEDQLWELGHLDPGRLPQAAPE